jgi:hypothetical protein
LRFGSVRVLERFYVGEAEPQLAADAKEPYAAFLNDAIDVARTFLPTRAKVVNG